MIDCISIFQYYLKSRLTSVLFSPHTIANRDEQQEANAEINNTEIENGGGADDDVWSQFKRKLKKDSSEKFVFNRSYNFECKLTF